MKCARVLSFLLFTCGISQPAFAHGAKIDYQQTSAIVIQASFDDGTPMANAQAIVYSPKDPSTPWLKGVTDELGKFTFVPESGLSGNWDVKVRQSGHGKIISIPLEAQPAETEELERQDLIRQESKSPKSEVEQSLAIADKSEAWQLVSKTNSALNSDYSWQQKMIMSVSVIWGFLGTALFFFASKPDQNTEDLNN